MEKFNVKDLAYHAVIEHHRLWLSSDGHYRLSVVDGGAMLNEEIAKQISKEYSVLRNIGGSEEVSCIINKINNVTWPQSLSDRYNACLNIANKHREYFKRPHTPISAVTKLMWFVRPTGWTMYDKYACIGMIGKKDEPKAYYEALDEADFQVKANQLSKKCADLGFSYLFGERIIDKFLLFRGWEFENSTSEKLDLDESAYFVNSKFACSHHLKLIPPNLSKALKKLAQTISEDWGDDFIPFKKYKKPRVRK